MTNLYCILQNSLRQRARKKGKEIQNINDKESLQLLEIMNNLQHCV